MGKPVGLISQIGTSGFGRTEAILAKEDDCFTSSSDINNNDDDTDDEYND
jgi:hypothetical protein